MAEKGRGKKVRLQGGGVFPIAMLSVSILGLLLIWYARSSVDAVAAGPRSDQGDRWHLAYGFYGCDTGEGAGFLDNLVGDIATLPRYANTGVNSHDDGIIYWYPTSAASSGDNARFSVFLDNYGVELTDETLTFPSDQLGGVSYDEGSTKCLDADGKEVDGVLKAFVWPDAANAGNFRTLTASIGDIHITEDGMAIVVAFVPADVDSVGLPASAALLPDLIANGGAPAATDTTVALPDTSVTDTTVTETTDTTVGATDTSAGS